MLRSDGGRTAARGSLKDAANPIRRFVSSTHLVDQPDWRFLTAGRTALPIKPRTFSQGIKNLWIPAFAGMTHKETTTSQPILPLSQQARFILLDFRCQPLNQ
jgi:hypothetical protein